MEHTRVSERRSPVSSGFISNCISGLVRFSDTSLHKRGRTEIQKHNVCKLVTLRYGWVIFHGTEYASTDPFNELAALITFSRLITFWLL